MPHTPSIDEARRCLVITYRGTVTYDERMRALRTALVRLDEDLLTGIVIDMRVCLLKFGAADAYEFGTHLSRSLPPRGTRVAYVVRDPVSDMDALTQLVASNRGLDTARFASLEKALQWASREDRAAGRTG